MPHFIHWHKVNPAKIEKSLESVVITVLNSLLEVTQADGQTSDI